MQIVLVSTRIPAHPSARTGLLLLAAALVCALPALAAGSDRDRGFCSHTADFQFNACKAEIADDFDTQRATCLNLPDAGQRSACHDDAQESRGESRSLCKEQRRARLQLCEVLGEDRYAPDFDPAGFEEDFAHPTHPNPYYPLGIGYVWEYEADGETTVVEVLDQTKLIEGVHCIVANDRVTGADFSEDTNDWFALGLDGRVLYCGEEVKDYEIFPGDDPPTLELVSIDGSFKVGRDGALPGTIMPATPIAGTTFRQEFSAGNAEDAATVVSTTYGYGRDPELDRDVPRDLAELLCHDDCVVTSEVNPLEPEALDRKYYAPGLGNFLNVDAVTGDTGQLVDCNFDPRCAALPHP